MKALLRRLRVAYCLLGFSVILQLVCSFGSVWYKGLAIAQLFEGQRGLAHNMIRLALLFSSLHIASNTFRILREHLIKLASADYFELKWRHLFPEKIRREDQSRIEEYSSVVLNSIPNWQSLRLQNWANIIFAVTVYALFVGLLVMNHFYLALVYLPIAVLLAVLSGRLFEHKLAYAIEARFGQRHRLSRWLAEYFRSARERQLNWPHKESVQSWYEGQGQRLADAERSLASLSVKKIMYGNFLVDTPFLIFSSALLLLVADGKMGIADLVVWTGLAEYLVAANYSFFEFLRGQRDERALAINLERSLAWLTENDIDADHSPTSKGFHCGSTEPTKRQVLKDDFAFTLADKSQVQLGRHAGLYHIRAANGTGKSSLIDALIGYSESFYDWDVEQLSTLRSQMENLTRYVDRNCILFSDFPSLMAQIYGPVLEPESGIEPLRENLEAQLGTRLSSQWLEILKNIQAKHIKDSTYSPSSGELVVISFMRALAFWGQTRFLILDEVDSFLDRSTRHLLSESLRIMANHTAIFLVSHNRDRTGQQTAPILSQGFLLGYLVKPQRAQLFDVSLTAYPGGSGEIVAMGNIGRLLGDELRMVINALAYRRASYAALRQMNYEIYCQSPHFEVTDVRSGSLLLAVLLENIMRLKGGKEALLAVAATGRVLPDGSTDEVSHLAEKQAAALASPQVRTFLSHLDIASVDQLSELSNTGTRAAKKSQLRQVQDETVAQAAWEST